MTTAAAAPALMPSRPGSASGLRVSDCISAPARPSEAPAAMPSSVRGTRRSSTIVVSWRAAAVTAECVHDVAERDRTGADREREQGGEGEPAGGELLFLQPWSALVRPP